MANNVEHVNLSAIASAAAETTDTSKGKVEEILKAAFENIKDEVKKGKQVDIPKFGSFKKNNRDARMGRNPQSGEQIQIAASSVPAFKASKVWKDALNQ